MLYSILKIVFRISFTILFRFEVIGRENIPREGAVVIASNHASLLDPPLIGTAASRKMHFMAKEELFVPILGTCYKILGAFPVSRGASDMGAIKHAIDILKSHEVLGIFPEGTRSKTGALGQAGSGTMLIAKKGAAAVVPTAVIGSNLRLQKSFWPKIKVVFGEPMYFTEDMVCDKRFLQSRTQEMMGQIELLIKKNS